MKSDNLVSVVMPCLNSEKTIVEAIESVLSQDYQFLELIIIDDGSIDSSIEIIKKYQLADKRISLIINNGQHGVSYARNLGIRASKGRFICFLDSDDYLLKDSLGLRVRTLDATNAKIVYGSYFRLLPNGRFVKRIVPLRLTLSQMLCKNYIGNLTGMYDAKSLKKKFQKPIGHEDYLMWCELLKLEKYALSVGATPIAVYRVSHNSLSGNKFKAFIWHWNVLRAGLGLNIFVSIYYQAYYLSFSLINRLYDAFKR